MTLNRILVYAMLEPASPPVPATSKYKQNEDDDDEKCRVVNVALLRLESWSIVSGTSQSRSCSSSAARSMKGGYGARFGVLASSPSCGSLRSEPKESQVDGARSIDVDLVAANADVTKSASIRIAASPLIRAELARSRSELTANSETLACCARQ